VGDAVKDEAGRTGLHEWRSCLPKVFAWAREAAPGAAADQWSVDGEWRRVRRKESGTKKIQRRSRGRDSFPNYGWPEEF